jgi:hypothetical protein
MADAFVTAGAANPVSVLVDGMQVYDTPGSNYSWGSVASERRNGKAVGLSDVYNLSGSVMLRNVDIRRCYGPALGFENWPNGQVSTMIENLTVTDSARQSHSWPGVPVPPVHMCATPLSTLQQAASKNSHVHLVRYDCTGTRSAAWVRMRTLRCTLVAWCSQTVRSTMTDHATGSAASGMAHTIIQRHLGW